MKQGDVSGGCGGTHVQARLPHGAAAIQGPCKGTHRAGHHQKLVNLLIYKWIVGFPHLGLQLRLITAVLLTVFQQVSDVSLVPVPYTNLAFISQEGLLLWVVD